MVVVRKSTRRLGRSSGSGSSGSRSKAPRRSMSPISEESAPIAPINSVSNIDAVNSQHSPYFLHSADHPGLLVAGSVFAIVMDLCSSFPGFSDFTSPSKEIVVDDNLFGEHPWLKLMIKPLFVYGSLPRPPDLQSTLVSTCLRTLLSQFLDFGARNVVANVVFLSYLASRYAHREGELRLDSLDSFKQILEYEINIGWLELLLEHPVFMFRTYVQLVSRECNMVCLILIYDLCKLTRLVFFVEWSTLCCGVVHELCLNSEYSFQHQNLSRQGENLKLAIDTCCLNLCEADCYDFLDFVFRVCEVVIVLRLLRVLAPAVDGAFVGFHATKIAAMVQHLSIFVKREVCSFEVLLIIVVQRLLLFHSCVEAQMRQMKRRSPQNEIFPQFHSYVSAHMRLMEQRSLLLDVMEVRLLSCLIKKNTSSLKWLDRHVKIGSQSCVSRQEEIWSRFGIFIHVADCVFAVKGLCLQQELFGWLKSFILVVIGCSRIEIDSDVVFALCATLELLLTQNLLQPHTTPNLLLYGLDCHGLVVQQSYSSVVGYNEIVVMKTVIIVASISQTISFVCKGLMRLFNDPFPHLVCSLAHSFAAAQVCLQGQSIDIGIVGLEILEDSSPRPHEAFMSKMRIPSHLEGEYQSMRIGLVWLLCMV